MNIFELEHLSHFSGLKDAVGSHSAKYSLAFGLNPKSFFLRLNDRSIYSGLIPTYPVVKNFIINDSLDLRVALQGGSGSNSKWASASIVGIANNSVSVTGESVSVVGKI